MNQSLKTLMGRFGSLGLYLVLTPWSRSLDLRVSHYDVSVNPARPEFEEPCIFVFWHEYIILPTMIWGKTNVTLFVSQHRDADWLVNIGRHFGFDAVRGSTTRGGPSAIRACKEKMRTHSLGVTPDGPKGPRREMALGAIYLASRLGRPIVPVGFGYDRPWRMNTWDNFAIPRPGSRVRALMGPKIYIPKKAGREELESYRVSITNDINRLTGICEVSAATGSDIENSTTFVKQEPVIRAKPLAEFRGSTPSVPVLRSLTELSRKAAA